MLIVCCNLLSEMLLLFLLILLYFCTVPLCLHFPIQLFVNSLKSLTDKHALLLSLYFSWHLISPLRQSYRVTILDCCIFQPCTIPFLEAKHMQLGVSLTLWKINVNCIFSTNNNMFIYCIFWGGNGNGRKDIWNIFRIKL